MERARIGLCPRNNENQELKTLAGSLPLLSVSYLWFFLWVALFLLTTNDFSLRWATWLMATYNFYILQLCQRQREKTDSIPKCQIKKFQGLAGFDQSTQLDQSPVASRWGYMIPAGPRAHHCFCRGGVFLEKGSIVSWAATPRAVSYNTPRGLIWTWLWSYCVSPAAAGNRSRTGGHVQDIFLNNQDTFIFWNLSHLVFTE